MRLLRSHLLLVATSALSWSAAVHAQEPTPPAEPQSPPQAEAPAEAPREEAGRPRRPRRQPIVVEAGFVHPVAGPAIENGVVVIRGGRIVAVGRKGDVEIPEHAQVRSFPDGHVYPGLVDAATDAYTDASLRGDGGLDAGAAFADDLRPRGTREDELVQAGITTAYVTVRSPSLLRGQGAIVRPKRTGFAPWEGKEQGGVQLRMTNGPQPTHALQRQQQLQAADGAFDGLEAFRKARTDHAEALKKYEQEFADYLAWHKKKKDEKDGKPATAKPAGDTSEAKPAETPADGPRPEGRERGRRRGGGGGAADGGDADAEAAEFERALLLLLEALPQDPPKPAPETKPDGQEPKPAAGTAPIGPPAPGEKKDEAPKRPAFPKPPPRDPNKEALLRVLDGELPLRVEVHRPDEVRAALRLQQRRDVPLLVLEQAYGAAALAKDIAEQGASVVLTDVLPNSLPKPYDDFDLLRLPATLQAAGVPFAIASGSARRAGLLPLMAAAAVGAGLDADAALRAVTLTPAEILGVAKDTGSLQAGKFADLVVTDRPLFATDSRVLLVLSQGTPEFEAQ